MNRVINKLVNQKFQSQNMLIVGEFGSGKERIARILHKLSDRSEGPFLNLNCEHININEAHRQFYGYAGYPEDALHPHKNAFEKSNGGALYLESFNSLSQDLQYTLIRSQVNEHTVRIGMSASHHTDVRFIIGLRPLSYHQFETFLQKIHLQPNINSIFIPPLRERKEDIPVLAKSFLKEFNQEYNLTVEGISSETMLKLYGYDWPGNIQQLENTIKQAICVTSDTELQLTDLPQYLLNANTASDKQ